MGKFYNYISDAQLKQFGIKIFVETGTSDGKQFLDYMRFNFDNYYSCEINEEQYNIAEKNVSHLENLHIFNQSSVEFLSDLLPKIKDIPTVFWLDAHLPGSELGLPFNYEKDKNLRMPLEDEIDLICKLKNTENDIIMCDDLRHYEDDKYTAGKWEWREELGGNGIDFIYSKFQETHNIEKNYVEGGCALILPKNVITKFI